MKKNKTKQNLACIICGKKLEDDYYLGKTEDMDLVFCEEHKDYCNNKCNIYSCNNEKCSLKEKNS